MRLRRNRLGLGWLPHSWLPRSLRAQLLFATVPLAVLGAVVSAWAANGQTRQALLEEFQSELTEPEKIRAALLASAQEKKWEGVDDTVGTISSIYDRRIVLIIDRPGEDDAFIDSARPGRRESVSDLPVIDAGHIAPRDEFLKAEREEKAKAVLIDCLRKANIGFEEAANGKVRILDEGRGAPCEAARQTKLDELRSAGQFDEADVYVSATPGLTAGGLFSAGISTRLVVIVGAVVALMTLVSILAARRVLRPVGQLTSVVGRMARGKFTERVPEGRRDELGDLARSFNSMSADLQAADEQRRRMTSDIAHELRTPLSNIRGYLEAAQDGVAELTPQFIDSIHEDTLLLQALVTDLQEIAQAEAGRLALDRCETDLGDVVRSVVAAHGARAAAQEVTLEADPGTDVVAFVDPRRIRQVVTNLTENALRHTPPGGRVAVVAARKPEAFLIEVTDTGAGIGSEHLERIFDRFYRADPSRNRSTGGSGLGLAITRELIHAHGGEITVRSELGRGSRFTVELPVTVPAEPPTTSADPSSGPSPPRPARTRPVLARSVGAAISQPPDEPASPLEPETITDVDR